MFNLLQKHNHGERLFEKFKAVSEKSEMAMKPDKLLDATLNVVVSLT